MSIWLQEIQLLYWKSIGYIYSWYKVCRRDFYL